MTARATSYELVAVAAAYDVPQPKCPGRAGQRQPRGNEPHACRAAADHRGSSADACDPDSPPVAAPEEGVYVRIPGHSPGTPASGATHHRLGPSADERPDPPLLPAPAARDVIHPNRATSRTGAHPVSRAATQSSTLPREAGSSPIPVEASSR